MNFRHFAQAFGRTFFGTEGIPAAASIGTPRGGFETFPDASGRQAPPAQLSLVLDGLTSACTQFLQQNIRPVVSLSPETVYAIHSIRLVMTPPTMGLLREIIRMPQPIRDRLARACVQKASGSTAFSLENFYGWSVEGDSLITEGEIVKVLVCNEDGPVTLDFVFDGNFEMGARQRREPPVCRKCEIEITRQTDHIIQITSNNGWIAYATYSPRDEMYRGMLEWKSGNGGRRTEPYSIELMRDGHRYLKMNAMSRSGDFNVTYERD